MSCSFWYTLSNNDIKMDYQNLYKEAYKFAKLGKYRKARKLLSDIVKEKDNDEKAWLGLSHLAQSYQEKAACLKKVLEINPENHKARQKLDSILAKIEIEAFHHQSHQQPARQPYSETQILKIFLGILLVFLIIGSGYGAGLIIESIYEEYQNDIVTTTSIDDYKNYHENIEDIYENPSLASQTSSHALTIESKSIFLQSTSNLPSPEIITNQTITQTHYLPQTSTFTPTTTPSLTASHTFTPIPSITLTNTPTIISSTTPSPTLSATPSATIPSKALILNINGEPQRLSLSCESRAAATWADFYGKQIGELEFFSKIPQSDNPEIGFVGDVNGEWGQIPPDSYGVHAEPVAQILQDYGLNAKAVRNIEFQILKNEVALGHPVIVWVIGHVEPGKGVPYIAQDGTETIVARFQHTVIFIGYNDEKENVVILDGESQYDRNIETFLQSWGVLGNMAVLWDSDRIVTRTP